MDEDITREAKRQIEIEKEKERIKKEDNPYKDAWKTLLKFALLMLAAIIIASIGLR